MPTPGDRDVIPGGAPQPDPSHQDVKHTPYLIRGRLWDAIGNLTKRENVAGAETEDFGYDFLDRLTSASNYFIPVSSTGQRFGNSGGPSNTVNGPTRAVVAPRATSWWRTPGTIRLPGIQTVRLHFSHLFRINHPSRLKTCLALSALRTPGTERLPPARPGYALVVSEL